MNRGTLIPSSAGVELVCIRPKAGVIHLELRACQVIAVCPSCGSRSTRVHSRYWRTIADLPWEGIPVRISLRARKFFCLDERCSRRIFTEPLPGTVSRYGRRSDRASDALSWVTLALGGRAGTRLARKLGLLASRTTLLHELRRRVPSSTRFRALTATATSPTPGKPPSGAAQAGGSIFAKASKRCARTPGDSSSTLCCLRSVQRRGAAFRPRPDQKPRRRRAHAKALIR